MNDTTAREKFERWFCEKQQLTMFPKPEHRPDAWKNVPTFLESAAEESWKIWKAGWDSK